MTIVEELEYIRKDIEYEIGEFDIIVENDKKLLIKSHNGCYFVAKKDMISKRFFIEDITWVLDKVLSKKKKQKYINNGKRKKENLLNGS